MVWMRCVLIFLYIHYGRSAIPDDKTKRDIGASPSAPIGVFHIPTRHTLSEYHSRVAVPVPQPVPLSIPRPVPYPVHIGVPVDSPRPVLVGVPHPVAHIIPRPFAVPVDRPFPYPVAHPVPVTVTQGVGIPVPQPYAIAVPLAVPVRVPVSSVGVPVSPAGVPVSAGVVGPGLDNAVGIGSGFISTGTVVSPHQPVVSGDTVESSHGHAIQHPY